MGQSLLASAWIPRVPQRSSDPFMTLFCCRYNQRNAISLACSAGVPGCKEVTGGWFRAWMKNPDNNTYSTHTR